MNLCLLDPAAERAERAGLVERVLAAKQPARDAAAGPGPAVEQPSHEATARQAVTALEREIDERVYRLYGLTKEEIRLVEESASAKATADKGGKMKSDDNKLS